MNRPLEMCAYGLHVTTRPQDWEMKGEAECYVAETKGIWFHPEHCDKGVYEYVRLVRPVRGWKKRRKV